jgi:thymidylate synthase
MEYVELLDAIMNEGEEVKGTRELLEMTLHVNKDCLYDFGAVRPLEHSLKYLQKELCWYLGGDRSAGRISEHAGLWDKIKNPDGTLNSNYGHLVFYSKTAHPSLGDVCLPAFEWAARALEKDWTTRQGMVTYNNGGYNFEGNRDYICSQHQAFYIRNNALHCFVALRSSDAIYGLTYNMPWWQFVYQQMWHRLRKTYPNLQEVEISVIIYSAHIYEKHYELVDKMLHNRYEQTKFVLQREIPLGKGQDWYEDNLSFTLQRDLNQFRMDLK